MTTMKSLDERLRKLEAQIQLTEAPPPPRLGEISTQDGMSSQVLTSQNTYYSLSQWTQNEPSTPGVTPDFSAGTLTIDSGGWYQIVFSASLQLQNSHSYELALFVNGVLHNNGKSQFTTAALPASPILNLNIGDVNKFAPGDVLDVRIQCTSAAGATVAVLQANFFAVSVTG